MSSVLENLHIGITLHDPETGAILDVNEQLTELYGYSADELRTMTVEEYTSPATRFTQEEAVRRIRAAGNGDPQSFEWQIERANGEYRWVSVHLTRTTIDGERCVVAEINDITEYKVREQLLRLLNRIVRHNLRNDMNILMGYADRIKGAIENDQLAEEVETIVEIAAEVGTLSDSLNHIEEIIKPNATQRAPTNLRTFVRTRVTQVSPEYPEVTLTVDAPSDVWVTADNGLQYAIDNAIENAVTHNDHDAPEVSVTVTEDPENSQGVVRIVDNGPAIPEIEIDAIEDEREVSSTYHGSGVGLWVMKWCTESLGGNLSFERNTPRGNSVEISVPTVTPSSGET